MTGRHEPGARANQGGVTTPLWLNAPLVPVSATIDRPALLKTVRSVVIKIGTNALSAANGQLDTALIAHVAEQIATLRDRSIRVTLVSSGAIGAGITELGLASRP